MTDILPMPSSEEIAAITKKVEDSSQWLDSIYIEIQKRIVGQEYLIERLLVGLLANGHVLLEGLPGLAKTSTVNALADAIDCDFKRIQFTPDLLPADIIGTLIYNPDTREYSTHKGPLFANMVLADEINRAPAKVQSALLEGMQERQVTIGDTIFKLPHPFLVLATQNPIEQEGTYPLPEAQMDRFMLKVVVGYPDRDEELGILRRMSKTQPSHPILPVLKPETILELREIVDEIYVDEQVEQYIVDLVLATRNMQDVVPKMAGYIRVGASPRASINLTLASKAYAFLKRRGYVTPDDVKAIAMDVLRHRIIPSFEAAADEVTREDLVTAILENVLVP
ncbi:MoxR family ATPase [Kiritimatiellota bacterium B12222]|nr:MoxR family ATPase [Kiritimatiellota bacterium B12222]